MISAFWVPNPKKRPKNFIDKNKWLVWVDPLAGVCLLIQPWSDAASYNICRVPETSLTTHQKWNNPSCYWQALWKQELYVFGCTKQQLKSSCFSELHSRLSRKISLCNFILPPSKREMLQQNPPLRWDLVNHFDNSVWPLLSAGAGTDVCDCSRVTAQQAAATLQAVISSRVATQFLGAQDAKMCLKLPVSNEQPRKQGPGSPNRETSERLAVTPLGRAWGWWQKGSS
jgi:hypothetical protein